MKAYATLLSALLVLAPFAAHADTIDQQNPGTLVGANGGAGSVGQSFTPTLDNITFATFTFRSQYGESVYATVLSGSGLGGTVLGTSNTVAVQGGGFVTDTFNFTPVTLTPGSVYTLKLNVPSSTYALVAITSGSTFNGTFYFPDGGSHAGNEAAIFSEGGVPSATAVAATPEPSGLVLLGTAAVGMAGMLRRRMRLA